MADLFTDFSGGLSAAASLEMLVGLVKSGQLTLADAVTLLTQRLVNEGVTLTDTNAVALILGAAVSGTLSLSSAVTFFAPIRQAGALTMSDAVAIIGGSVGVAIGNTAVDRPQPVWLLRMNVRD